MRISEQQTQAPQLMMRQAETKKHYNPNFKGTGVVGIMDAIERGGLAASFTVQDMLGTNLPRPIMGLKRNKKENAGKTNTAFALKEAIREFTTGPSMFIIPAVILHTLKKGFKAPSLNVPTKFIKGMGDIYKDTINPSNISQNKEVIKKDFYKNVLGNMLEATTGKTKDNFAETIEDFADKIIKLETAKGNGTINNIKGCINKDTKEDILAELTDKFINISKKHTDAGNDFLSAKIKNADMKEIETSFDKVISYMTDYANDAIDKTQKIAKKLPIDNLKDSASKFIENFNVKRINQRALLNLGMLGAILSFLSVIPKIYNLTSKGDPGIVGLGVDGESTTNNAPQQTNSQTQNAKAPSFGSAPATIAKNIVGDTKLSKFIKGMEFNGIDMSFPMLMTAMLGGVLRPRVKEAKSDYDKKEIIRRDTISIATMGVGAKIASKLFAKANESKSGFVLTQKADNFANKNAFERFLEYLRPINGVHVLSSKQLASKYGDLNQYKNGIDGFCDFIDNGGGNLKKVFSYTDKTKEILENICGKEVFNNADNKTIKSAIAKARKEGSKQIDELCEQFGKAIKDGTGKTTYNNFVNKAKSMNSTFGFLATFVIVPVFLGFMLPAINEKATKKEAAKRKAANAEPPKGTNTNNVQTPSPKVQNTTSVEKVFKHIQNFEK